MMTPGCSGKHAYASAIRAWRVLRRHKRMYGRRFCRMLGAYRCGQCGRWHIGKNFRSASAALLWED